MVNVGSVNVRASSAREKEREREHAAGIDTVEHAYWNRFGLFSIDTY